MTDIKTILNQELNNAGMSYSKLPGVSRMDTMDEENKNEIDSQALNDITQKMDELLAVAANNNASNEKSEAKLDEQTLNEMMGEFKESMSEILRKDVIQNINTSTNDRKEFENSINERIDKIAENVGQSSNEEKMNQMMKEAVQQQLALLQVGLENSIGQTVSGTVEDSIDKKINEALRADIKKDMNSELNELKELIMKTTENMEQKATMEDTTSGGGGGGQINEEMLSAKLEDCMNNVMNGKIDGFMDSFRKEVVPEVQAVFEQLSLSKAANGGYNGSDFVDDEKANSSSELISRNNALMKEIEVLKAEKEGFDEQLKRAATSKVHEIVKLQNLLDHMREDNRQMSFQLNKYREKFVEIKETQENNVVNKFWGYWNNTNNHVLST